MKAGDLGAQHPFHHEVWPAGIRGPGVKHMRDVRMIHQRQRLPFRLKPRDDALGVHSQPDDFQRDFAMHRLLLLRQIYHTTAALAQLLLQPVTADYNRSGLR